MFKRANYGSQRTHVSYEFSTVLETNGRGTSSNQIVSMMQATDSWHSDDHRTSRRAFPGLSRSRRLLAQPKMGEVVVVVDVFAHQASQVTFIKNDDMVEQVTVAVANKSLSHAVLPWALKTGSFSSYTETLNCLDDYSEEMMHAALEVNLPNYASAIVTTSEVLESISLKELVGDTEDA
jgi:hypothetical protein